MFMHFKEGMQVVIQLNSMGSLIRFLLVAYLYDDNF